MKSCRRPLVEHQVEQAALYFDSPGALGVGDVDLAGMSGAVKPGDRDEGVMSAVVSTPDDAAPVGARADACI